MCGQSFIINVASQFIMASDCSDDSVSYFPPLIQNMRLNIEGGPKYRGSRGGRAAAAYYREKEAAIAIKNKYGNRYGRRILSYKPDTEAWRPERYQRHIGTLNSHTSEVIPGGLQNEKHLIHNRHDWLARTAARVDHQEGFSRKYHIHDKYSSGTIKGEGIPVIAHRTSHTVDLVELGRPAQQGRGVMRGKRVVDLSTIYCSDEKEECTVNYIINPEKTEPESCIQEVQGKVIICESSLSPSEIIESDEKEQLTVNAVINPEKTEPESCLEEAQGNVIIHDSSQSPSELIKSVESLSIL